MKAVIAILIVLGATVAAEAQVAPEGTSPSKLGISGTVTYSAYNAYMFEDYGGTTGQMDYISGNFGYSTTSERYPTSIQFAGGDGWTISGTGYNSGLYENLSLSQGMAGKKSSLQLSDNVGYFRGTPITGFSGVPGTGQPISGSGSSPSVNVSIFTLNTSMLNQDANATYTYKLTGRTSLSAGGGGYWLIFPDGGGYDTDMYDATAGVTHMLTARNSVNANYMFYEFTYPGTSFTADVSSVMAGWQRTWTRAITTNISVGPQWMSSSGSGSAATGPIPPIPSTTGVSASASLTDNNRYGSASLSYFRGVMAGGGYLYSGEEDTATGSFGHEFGHQIGSQLNLEFSAGYFRYSSLGSQTSISGVFNGDSNGTYGSAQATRNLGRYVSVYANYTATDESFGPQTSGIPSNALTSLWQMISIGIGYTPRPIHLRH